jgi:hypothetical protein
MGEINWPLLLGVCAILVGILLAPYDLLFLIQRIWEQRRRERIARGEDVRPHKLPWWDPDEE